jgi:hypothetical protein
MTYMPAGNKSVLESGTFLIWNMAIWWFWIFPWFFTIHVGVPRYGIIDEVWLGRVKQCHDFTSHDWEWEVYTTT